MKNRLIFSDSRFGVRFRYPNPTPQGYPVEVRETDQAGLLRAHLVSNDSQEIYFELTRYSDISAQAAYAELEAALKGRFGKDVIMSELQDGTLAGLPVLECAFRWPQGERRVIFVQRDEALYRLLYNPQSPLNEQILAAVEFI